MKIFIENQRINQWWLILIIVVLGLTGPVLLISNWDSFAEDSSESRLMVLVAVAVELLVFAGVLSISLKTRIDEIGVHYMLYPIHWRYRTLLWIDIQTCHIRKYKPLSEFGGWGIKPGLKKKFGKSFTVRGTTGLQLELKTGKKILIGTQEADKVERALATYKHKYELDEMV